MIYSVFRSLGLHVDIHPRLEQMEDEDDHGWGERIEEEEGNLIGTGLHGIQLIENDEDSDKREVMSTLTSSCNRADVM